MVRGPRRTCDPTADIGGHADAGERTGVAHRSRRGGRTWPTWRNQHRLGASNPTWRADLTDVAHQESSWRIEPDVASGGSPATSTSVRHVISQCAMSASSVRHVLRGRDHAHVHAFPTPLASSRCRSRVPAAARSQRRSDRASHEHDRQQQGPGRRRNAHPTTGSGILDATATAVDIGGDVDRASAHWHSRGASNPTLRADLADVAHRESSWRIEPDVASGGSPATSGSVRHVGTESATCGGSVRHVRSQCATWEQRVPRAAVRCATCAGSVRHVRPRCATSGRSAPCPHRPDAPDGPRRDHGVHTNRDAASEPPTPACGRWPTGSADGGSTAAVCAARSTRGSRRS